MSQTESLISNTSKKQTGPGNVITEAWLLLMLALLFGMSLALVHIYTGPIIEENKISETLAKIPFLILGNENAGEVKDLEIDPFWVQIDGINKSKSYQVYRVSRQEIPVGWAVKTGGQGYADKIELLLGLDADAEKITGVFILDQKETPGLGNKIASDQWRNQFVDRSVAAPFIVVKGNADSMNEIDSVTGATISSESVCRIINSAIQDLQPQLLNSEYDNRGEGK